MQYRMTKAEQQAIEDGWRKAPARRAGGADMSVLGATVSDDIVYKAAVRWCGRKERETSLDDIRYFEWNWRSLPGLRAVVDEIIRESQL